MKVLDLFSGIGGFSLGLERAGMKTIAFCEIEEFPRRVLKKHWPNVPIYKDVRNVTKERLQADGIAGIEIVTGGFPCQDLSCAGKQIGLSGERSGLWGELCRIIGDVRPKYAIVENVSNLITGGRFRGEWFSILLGDLVKIGYDAEWHCIPASAIGANHHRDRIWIVAYPNEIRWNYGYSATKPQPKQGGAEFDNYSFFGGKQHQKIAKKRIVKHIQTTAKFKSRVCRRDDGVPNWMDRIAALGNAVVPQIPEIIGRAIMECEGKA